MPEIKVTLSIGYANSRQEDVISIDTTEWEKCDTDEERQELMDSYWKDWSSNYIDGSAELIE